MKVNKVVSNSIWIMAENILQMVISLIVGMISARFLGPSNYGLINYGASFVSLFGVIARLGIGNIIIKEFVDNPDDAGELIGTTVILRIIASGISLLLIWISIGVLNGYDRLLLTVTMLQSFSICFQGIDIIGQWYQSRLESKKVSIARSIAYIGVAVYKVMLLFFEKDVRWFAFATTLEYIIILFSLLIIYVYTGGPKWSVSLKTAKRLLYSGFPFIWSGLILVAYMQMDKLMLGYYLGNEEVGLYSAAATIGGLWGFVPGAIIDSMNPVITANWRERDYEKNLILLFSIVIWIGILICLGITLFSKIIILLFYGTAYIKSSIALAILSWSTMFAYLGTARGIFLVNEKLNSYSIVFITIGGVANLLLNFIFIQCWKIEGAAMATLITQIIAAVISPMFFAKTRVIGKYYVKALSPKRVISIIKGRKFYGKH